MLIRKTICSVALILLTAGSFGAASFAAATVGNGSSIQPQTTFRRHPPGPCKQRQLHPPNPCKQGSQGAATKSNPNQAKTSKGTLNPQPIPPGKQRRPE
jgi:hypothetical protein